MKPAKATPEDVRVVIDIVLTAMQSTDENAGWHPVSSLYSLIQFKGDIPPPSGNDSSNGHMINAIDKLSEKDPRLPIAIALINLMPTNYSVAIVADRYYEKRNTKQGTAHTGRTISKEINMKYDTFKKSKRLGYERLMAGIDIYRHITDIHLV